MQEIIQVLLENLNAEWQYAGPRRIFGWETSKKGQWDYIVKYVPINKPYLLLQEIIPILGFKKDEADSSFSYKEMNEDIINITFLSGKDYEIQKRTLEVLESFEDDKKQCYRNAYNLNAEDAMQTLRAIAQAEILQEETKRAEEYANELRNYLEKKV